MFRNRTQARAALLDPRFPTRAPGLAAIIVDYDPAVWLRSPVAGEDRTAWHDRALAALAQDWRLSPSSAAYQLTDEILDRVADDPLSHDVTFVCVLQPGLPSILTIDVVDEELTLLERGDADRWLAFDDLEGVPGQVHPTAPAEPVPGSELRQATRGTHEGTTLLRAHRRLRTDPELHLSAFALLGGPKQSKQMFSAGLLIRSVRGETADGRLL